MIITLLTIQILITLWVGACVVRINENLIKISHTHEEFWHRQLKLSKWKEGE